MGIDPKQIARMITEDPDEVNPLDNIEDEFVPEGHDFCSGCAKSYWSGEMFYCRCDSPWCDKCVDKSKRFDVEGYESFNWSDPEDAIQTDLTRMIECPTCGTGSWDY